MNGEISSGVWLGQRSATLLHTRIGITCRLWGSLNPRQILPWKDSCYPLHQHEHSNRVSECILSRAKKSTLCRVRAALRYKRGEKQSGRLGRLGWFSERMNAQLSQRPSTSSNRYPWDDFKTQAAVPQLVACPKTSSRGHHPRKWTAKIRSLSRPSKRNHPNKTLSKLESLRPQRDRAQLQGMMGRQIHLLVVCAWPEV